MHEIVDAVWPHSPPATARHQVLTVISALRRHVGDMGQRVLQTRSPALLGLGDVAGCIRHAEAALGSQSAGGQRVAEAQRWPSSAGPGPWAAALTDS